MAVVLRFRKQAGGIFAARDVLCPGIFAWHERSQIMSEWVAPDFVEISLSCECTAYAGAR